ncbi:hypothetical protein [Pseudalkalibacillus caeni]|uniref:Protein-export membrane protein SecG n=1 Tax=Exobacillus caeni TaxID=2574798 RepID=A0A5R9F3V1_9BACL|nr:hypothetical protein [Pseudalkalibacillus caeni]TLS37179.1 hypothetical protein FCL54_11675 [Pseudalkalibacillus caeni]
MIVVQIILLLVCAAAIINILLIGSKYGSSHNLDPKLVNKLGKRTFYSILALMISAALFVFIHNS